MIAIWLAATLQASDPSATESLQGLEKIYAESCTERAYGSYDDMCDSIATQIRRMRAEARRRPKPKPAPARVSAAPAAAAQAPAASAASPATPTQTAAGPGR
jgi:hypothetical protein